MQSGASALVERRITNIFEPYATPADAEKDIGIFVMAVTGVILVIVWSLLIYSMVRFRAKRNDQQAEEPAQVYGSNQIEIAWTFIPILIVFVLIGVTARVIAAVQDQQPGSDSVRARIVGHQWWWEVHFPDLGVVTANEIHVPLAGPSGRRTFVQLESMDVAHSFWVPQLSGKLDLIPNQTNTMWMDPREPGIYLGNCAEYCGMQHANMLLRVTAEPMDQFMNWAALQRASIVEGAQGAPGRAVFESLSCVNCHAVRGTVAEGRFGPDLTHVASRLTIAAGMITNSRENLTAWVRDPQEMKPGTLMPSMKLEGHDLDSVVDYLAALK
jgi:cytochrome c oxidase subunit II